MPHPTWALVIQHELIGARLNSAIYQHHLTLEQNVFCSRQVSQIGIANFSLQESNRQLASKTVGSWP
ncbi:MAG: hypothetical protein CMJ72_11960 [Planctomycetaceae bacterium]|nr:hypothetical protein [Planctomycetaceae bacterium]